MVFSIGAAERPNLDKSHHRLESFTSGHEASVSGRTGGLGLPLQNLANLVGLPFADNNLQGIAECDAPALATHRGHLADLIDVYDSVAVNPLKLGLAEAFFDAAEGLGCQQSLPRCNDPNQFPLGLKS
jgi:hypothetical protein